MEPARDRPVQPPVIKTEAKPKAEMPSTEFSALQLGIELLTPKNLERYFKIVGCWINAQSMQLQGHFNSDEKLIHASKIYLAVNKDHKECKIFETFSHISFQDHLLITARNIANKEVLMNETDKAAYINLRNSLSQAVKEKNLEKMLGYGESFFTDEFLKSLGEDFEPKSIRVNGVCFSANLYLMGKILNSPELNENILLGFAQELHKGVPAEVAAKQEMLHEMKFIPFTGEPSLDMSQESSRLNLVNDITNMLIDRAERQGERIPENFSKEVKGSINNVIDEITKYNQQYNKYLPNKAVVKKSEIFQVLNPNSASKNLQKQFLPLHETSLRNLDDKNKSLLRRCSGILIQN